MTAIRGLIASLLALVLIWPESGQAARLTVLIDHLRSDDGQVMVALFTETPDFPDGDYAELWEKLPARRDGVKIVFDGIPPGRYALGAYHDENGNGTLDTSLIGWPAEGYALSNGIRLSYYRPSFSESAFTMDEGDKTVVLHIGY